MVKSKVKELGLQLAEHKTETVLLQGRRKINLITLNLEEDGHLLRISGEIRYLGVIIDKDMKMTTHVKDVTKRIDKMVNNLKSIMSNIGGPRLSVRKIIVPGAFSTLMRLLQKSPGQNKPKDSCHDNPWLSYNLCERIICYSRHDANRFESTEKMPGVRKGERSQTGN